MTNDAQLAAMQSLLDEVSTALAELVEFAAHKKDAQEEVSSTLVDICEALKSGASTDALAKAIQGIRISPTINVSPTPVTVEVKVPQQAAPNIVINAPDITLGASWEIRIPGRLGEQDRVAKIKRLK